MDFFVSRDVLELGVKVVFVVAESIDNVHASATWDAERPARLEGLVGRWDGVDLHADPVLEGFHELHDRAHVRRKHNVPAPVTLIKLLVKRDAMPYVNKLVDIYNTCSIQTRLALGAHDLDAVDGDVILRMTSGTERYVPLGEHEPVPVAAGEYAYCDGANDVLCRLEVRQVEKTAVTPSTTRSFVIVQGNAATSDEYVHASAVALASAITRHCGGTTRIVVPAVAPRS